MLFRFVPFFYIFFSRVRCICPSMEEGRCFGQLLFLTCPSTRAYKTKNWIFYGHVCLQIHSRGGSVSRVIIRSGKAGQARQAKSRNHLCTSCPQQTCTAGIWTEDKVLLKRLWLDHTSQCAHPLSQMVWKPVRQGFYCFQSAFHQECSNTVCCIKCSLEILSKPDPLLPLTNWYLHEDHFHLHNDSHSF